MKWAAGATLVWLAVLTATPGANTSSRATPAITPATGQEPLTEYRALRRMHARSEKFGHEGWSERGSEYIRNKVLRELLTREQDMIARGHSSRAALTSSNYEFSEPAEQQPGEHHVLLKPKRKDVLLVDGRMVMSPDGRELRRVEGQLAKNPSFWTSLVKIVRRYARLDGVSVPISVESTARIKIAGASHMTVQYEYESVNGRPVSVAGRRMAAAAAAAR